MSKDSSGLASNGPASSNLPQNGHCAARHALVVTAAGSSSRFNSNSQNEVKKEFLMMDGLSVLACAVKPFLEAPGLAAVVVAYRKGLMEETRDSLKGLGVYGKVPVFFVEGGATRQESVFNALSLLKSLCSEGLGIELVSIHDGARPFVSASTVKECLEAAYSYGGAAPCVPVSDTLVRVADDGFLTGRLDRTGVHGVQTPQTFRFPEIYNAHVKARGSAGSSSQPYTDDTQIFTEFGGRVFAVKGSPNNRKITYRNDLENKA